MGKRMEEIYQNLEAGIVDVLETTDFKELRSRLEQLSEPIVCTGSGGSQVVADFAQKVLEKTFHKLALREVPRDLYHQDLSFYRSLFLCSHRGKNHSVTLLLRTPLEHFVFGRDLPKKHRTKATQLSYHRTEKESPSFVAIASTLEAMAVLLQCSKSFSIIPWVRSVFQRRKSFPVTASHHFEIFSGKETSTCALFLESSLVEGGLGDCIVHDKYEYCHGRSTLSVRRASTLIYLLLEPTELDQCLLHAPLAYDQIIILESKESDLKGNYELCLQGAYLLKQIADSQKKDLANVKYAPAVSTIYHFRGDF